eukprot:TRINITY_DN3073_c0_g4_i4.p1 TRINITY_DN3073_c0_g4~~TRINITY_DN3073_c0_g4_i4.p1  ORF type:complete len:347 (-),score=114.67 TRINITY_DN3073_c0_g4_i4:122-1162(-)
MESEYVEIGGNYVIMNHDSAHKLGRGAFADVYRCRKLVGGKLLPEIYVAKEIHFQRKIPNMKELILREIYLMFQLTGESPSIITVHDHFMGKTPNEMYIIMEYCEGGDLERYTEAHGPFLESEVAEFLYPVATSFAMIHSKDIIHRDLKLANILLVKKPEKGVKPVVKITDFGLAYALENQQAAHTTCGTPLYMAPEIWSRDKKGYSCKIDVWAYGNMLYKMMYGLYVFEDYQVEKRIKEGIIRFPKVRFTSLEAMDLILKCLRKNPEKRISFDEIVVHPFFKKRAFKVFDKVFDGYFGHFEVNIDNTYDLLEDPNCLNIPSEEVSIFDKNNEETIKEWRKADYLN